jgi:hypothetical protein
MAIEKSLIYPATKLWFSNVFVSLPQGNHYLITKWEDPSSIMASFAHEGGNQIYAGVKFEFHPSRIESSTPCYRKIRI